MLPDPATLLAAAERACAAAHEAFERFMSDPSAENDDAYLLADRAATRALEAYRAATPQPEVQW